MNDNDNQFQAKLLGFLGEVESPWQTSSLPRCDKEYTEKIERCKRQATHVTILLQDGAFVPNKHRAFLMDTQVKYTIGLQSQERNLFLFNDLLLIAKERSSSHFKLKDQVIMPLYLPPMHSNLLL